MRKRHLFTTKTMEIFTIEYAHNLKLVTLLLFCEKETNHSTVEMSTSSHRQFFPYTTAPSNYTLSFRIHKKLGTKIY